VAPPFVGVAVNITFVPEQIVVVLAAMLTAGATVELSVIVTALDVAVACITQVNDEVMIAVTTSLFAKAAF
jgi:hypothetical protein